MTGKRNPFASFRGWREHHAKDRTKVTEHLVAYEDGEAPTEYQKEIEEKYAEIDKLYKDYQAEKVLLTEGRKKKREGEIITKERQTKELQMKYFGRDGLLFKKREELVKPIQDQVFNTVKEIAVEGGYAVIFDSAASPNMLYTNPRHDKSEEVLQKLGYK